MKTIADIIRKRAERFTELKVKMETGWRRNVLDTI